VERHWYTLKVSVDKQPRHLKEVRNVREEREISLGVAKREKEKSKRGDECARRVKRDSLMDGKTKGF